jgi:hypothetical protein
LRVRDLSVAGWRIYLEFERWRVNCPRCGGVHVEHLDWLAKNPRYTQRFAMQVGKLCRDMPNKAVAEIERLHHSTVKDLDKLYMQKQIDLAGLPAPRAIGVDEISIRKGHHHSLRIDKSCRIGALSAGNILGSWSPSTRTGGSRRDINASRSSLTTQLANTHQRPLLPI